MSGDAHEGVPMRLVRLLPAALALAVCAVPLTSGAARVTGPPAAWPAMSAVQSRLTASDGGPRDRFGEAVAVSGDTALVGMPYEDDYTGAGAAYVFVRSGGVWTQQARLTAADGLDFDWFGESVALSGDTALVGARHDTVGSNADQGSAYVFTRSGTSWTQQDKLTADAGAGGDELGSSVALDDGTAVVGGTGSAYVFTRSGTTWSQQDELVADGAAAGWFGSSVAVSGDTALVGAFHVTVGADADQGSAYVFTRSGTTWAQQDRLLATDGAAGDNLGRAVSLSGDTALVGAPGDDNGPTTNQGSAYVFTRSGTSWTQQVRVTADDGAAYDGFGESVALSGDAALVGSPYDGGVGTPANAHGSAYAFTRSGSTWTQRARLVAGDAAGGDWFGSSVALSGATAVVGAPGDDVGAPAADVDQGSASAVLLDTAPPTTAASLNPLSNDAGWSRTPVTVTLGAVDDFAGVESSSFRLGGAGAYTAYDPGAKPVVTAPGPTPVWYYSTDRAGNAETPRSLVVRVDTTRPVTRALANATVVRGHKVALRLRVNDTVSPRARVTVRIYRGSVLKKTLRLGLRSTNTEIRYAFSCRLARGTYTWKVRGTDLAGNPQSTTGHKTLTVR